jgi:hypothetical protein
MALLTASLEASLAFGELLMTRDTVATETPASRATSLIVGIENIPVRVNVYTGLSVTEKPRHFKGATVVALAKRMKICGAIARKLHRRLPENETQRQEAAC